MISRALIPLALSALLALSLPFAVLAQEQPADEQPPAAAQPDILFTKLEWVLSDMVRCIEELRLTKDNPAKRMLVEQVEELLYEEVEFPLFYMQADSANPLDASNIGVSSDVVDSGMANPLAPLYAEAFALAGIAKGFEGYQAAANDYIERAKAIYMDVLSIKVMDESTKVPRDLGQWLADAQGGWGATSAVRMTFYGKAVSQDVVDSLNLETLRIRAEQPGRKELEYQLLVAERDLLRGLRRYVITDDMLTQRRSNVFFMYLPPGRYRLTTGVSLDYGTSIEVHTNPNLNNFMVETLERGIAIYPVPNSGELGNRGPAAGRPKFEGEVDQQGSSSGGSDAQQ